MNNTEATLRLASRALAKAVCKIRQADAELADRLARVLAGEIEKYRDVKRRDAWEVEAEARTLATVGGAP